MRDFAKEVGLFALGATEATGKVIVESTKILSTKMILRTPLGNQDLWEHDPKDENYKSGNARLNWQASINNPTTTSKHGGMDKGRGTSAPMPSTSSKQAVASANLTAESAPGNIYYLTNNNPYIRRLEYGAWSTQAPSGFVRVTLSEWGQIIKSTAEKFKQ